MNYPAFWNALLFVLIIWNAINIFKRVRHYFPNWIVRWWRAEDSVQRRRFKTTDSFLGAVHALAHEYGVDVAGVAVDPKTKSLQTFTFGVTNCDDDALEAVLTYEHAASWLLEDAKSLRAQLPERLCSDCSAILPDNGVCTRPSCVKSEKP